MNIQLPIGGRSGTEAEHGGMLPLRADMASLTAASKNVKPAGKDVFNYCDKTVSDCFLMMTGAV